MSWELELEGTAEAFMEVPEVVGKQRPRATVAMGHARVYTPNRTRLFEARVRKAWIEQVGERFAGWKGPVAVDVLVSRELAKSNPKHWAGRQDIQAPDADNVLKAVLDALNGLAYKDDRSITKLQVQKLPRLPKGDGNRISIHIYYYSERETR